MSVGAFIDRHGLEALDLRALTLSLQGRGVITIVGEVTTEALVDFASENGLAGLVVATRDERDGWETGRESLRRVGEQPFALRIVNLADLCARVHPPREGTAKAALMVAAAAAMVKDYRSIRPANVRLRIGSLSGGLTRRDLLTMARRRYEVIPAVDESRCAAARGCDLCARACPFDAIGLGGASASVDKDRCRDCGLCVSACPTGAIDHPFYSRRVLDAGLAAALGDRPKGGEGRVVAFACRGAMATLREAGRRQLDYTAAIMPVEIPSIAFVDLYLVLRALDLGAVGVAILSCNGTCTAGCRAEALSDRFSAMERTVDALGLGNERLALICAGSVRSLSSCLGMFAEHVLSLPPHVLCQELPVPAEEHLYEASGLLAGISRRIGIRGTLSVGHEGLPFGIPEFDAEGCSLCGLCADACPTGALKYAEDGASARLEFDARDCTGCRLCAAACPEKALRIERRLALSSLRGGTGTLKGTPMARCWQCGQPFAAEAMLGRILSRLGDKASTRITSYCPDCRMTADQIA